VVVTSSGTLTFSDAFSGSYIFDNIDITIPANFLTGSVTVSEYFELERE